jgi:hypothetical protein
MVNSAADGYLLVQYLQPLSQRKCNVFLGFVRLRLRRAPQGKRIKTAKTNCFENLYKILTIKILQYLSLNFRTPNPWKGSRFSVSKKLTFAKKGRILT